MPRHDHRAIFPSIGDPSQKLGDHFLHPHAIPRECPRVRNLEALAMTLVTTGEGLARLKSLVGDQVMV